jgi:hypothetical protein
MEGLVWPSTSLMLYLPSNKDNMNKYEIEVLKETLEKQLIEVQKMWDNKEPHAMIVGYLQGTVKGVISHLETKLK